MFTARKFARLAFSTAALIALLAGTAVSQTAPKLPGIVVGEVPNGIRISLSAGTLGNPRVLRLSRPDRLVLDFDQASLYASAAELERWRSLGVRIAFHAEDQTTRVVFDIPMGQQRWMKREGDAFVVTYQAPTNSVAQTVVAPRSQPTIVPRAIQPTTSTVTQKIPPRWVSPPRTAGAPAQQGGVEGSEGAGTRLQVISQNGLLQVSARGVSFQAILSEIASSTGASLQQMTPIDTNKTEIFEYGPAPPMEVIKKLFEGSNYNYVLVSEPNSTTRISRIVVTSTLRLLPGNDGPVTDDDTNPESLSGIAPLPPQTEEKKPN